MNLFFNCPDLLNSRSIYNHDQARNQLIFSVGENDCNLLLYVTTKHVFEISRFAPLVAGLSTIGGV